MARPLTARKSTKDAQTKAGIRWLCQNDLYALARTVLYSTAHVPMTDGFHKPICEWFQLSPDDLHLLLVPRDFYKTGVFNVARNVQRILKDPSSRTLIVSNKAENAEAMLSGIKAALINPVLLWAFPDILVPDPDRQAPRWTTGSISVKRTVKPGTKEDTVETIGEAGEITSKHYDFITYDDLVGENNSQTREALAATRTWWQRSQGLCEPWTVQDIIGTPWHYADLYGWLQEQHKKGELRVAVYKRACWENPDGSVPSTPGPQTRATFPERWTIPKLIKLKGIQGSAVFAAQRLLDPQDDETAVFSRKLAKIVPRRDVPPLDTLWIVMTVDPAISTNAWADKSAIATTGWDQQGRCWVLDLRAGLWREDETIAQMYVAFLKFPGMVRSIGFEAIGFAKIYRRLLEREGQVRHQYLPVVSLERDTKITKNLRIRTLQPLWENGEIMLVDDLLALEDFLDEASRFRTYKESAHDDLLDALADSLQLRLMPGEPEKHDSLYDDPELVERIAFEQALQKEREQTHQATLDRLSLRHAWNAKLRRDSYEQEIAAGASAMGEFY